MQGTKTQGARFPLRGVLSRIVAYVSAQRRKTYTLMLVPNHQPARVVRLKSSRATLLVVGALVGGLLTTATLLTADSLRVRTKLVRLRSLDAQNTAQSIALRNLEERARYLDQEMMKIKRFDHKLRRVMNLEPPKEETSLVGAGGAPEEDPTYYGDLAQEEQMVVENMNVDFDTIDYDIHLERNSLEEIEAYILEQQSIIDSMPTLRPVPGWLTSRFGYRRSPYTGMRQFHRGLDMSNAVGTPVIAPADGLVAFASRKGPYGNLVVIDHGYGYSTRFAHLSEILVRSGQRVKRRQIIAALGNTGISTGPHVHYEVRLNGIPTDPESFFFEEE